MRHLMITSAALALAVVPAAAQSGSQSSGPQQKGASAHSSGQRSQINAMSQDKLRKTLQQAGFKDIDVVDAAYIVHARTNDGDMVVMYIVRPPRQFSPSIFARRRIAPSCPQFADMRLSAPEDGRSVRGNASGPLPDVVRAINSMLAPWGSKRNAGARQVIS